MEIIAMVYCTKCGMKNEDDSKFCLNCGAALHPEEKAESREDTCFGRPERHVEEECFGLPYGGMIIGVIFGVFIVLLGLAIALGQDIGRFIGPFILIVIGLLVVAGALYSLSRRRKG